MTNPNQREETGKGTIPKSQSKAGTLTRDTEVYNIVSGSSTPNFLTLFAFYKTRSLFVWLPASEELVRVTGIHSATVLELEKDVSAISGATWEFVDAQGLVFYSVQNNPAGATGTFNGANFPAGQQESVPSVAVSESCDAAKFNATGSTFYIMEQYGVI